MQINYILRLTRKLRLGDQLGGWYTPIALGVAAAAALLSGKRFLAVVVNCHAVPITAGDSYGDYRRDFAGGAPAIIIKNPAVLEQIEKCQTLIFDKTGTLTYGRPNLAEIICANGFERAEVLRWGRS
jgi:hypothetical protein